MSFWKNQCPFVAWGADEMMNFSLTDKESDKPGFKTTNVMGFFSLDEDVRVKISSRFDNSGKDFFLHYMLQLLFLLLLVILHLH